MYEVPEDRKTKIEEAKKYLDSVLTDEGLHVVMVSMQDSTKTMAVHVINASPEIATGMLQVAATFTAPTEADDPTRRAH